MFVHDKQMAVWCQISVIYPVMKIRWENSSFFFFPLLPKAHFCHFTYFTFKYFSLYYCSSEVRLVELSITIVSEDSVLCKLYLVNLCSLSVSVMGRGDSIPYTSMLFLVVFSHHYSPGTCCKFRVAVQGQKGPSYEKNIPF